MFGGADPSGVLNSPFYSSREVVVDERPVGLRGVRGDAPCCPKHTMVMVNEAVVNQ